MAGVAHEATLFTPLRVGALELPNRVIMAPMTRTRASPGRIPNALMAKYYAQRASAGLIISEGTCVTPMGVGYPNTPGIWSREQVEGWKLVTRALHAAGGRIFCQLWHVGRVSDPSLLPGNVPPVGPCAEPCQGHVSLLRPIRPHPVPRALEDAEMPGIVEQFRFGATNAKEAGFDGVELHAANGYLIDQFLQDSVNKRQTGPYAGTSVQTRARLLLEVVDAMISVWGADRVGVHLAPGAEERMNGGDSDRLGTFGYVCRELSKRGIAFVFSREKESPMSISSELRKQFSGVWIQNEQFTQESAEAAIREGRADAVAWAKAWISNPDLTKRLLEHAKWNEWATEKEKFYGDGPHGYVDFPTLEDQEREKQTASK